MVTVAALAMLLLIGSTLLGYVEMRVGASPVIVAETMLGLFLISTVVFITPALPANPDLWIQTYVNSLPGLAVISVPVHVLPFYFTWAIFATRMRASEVVPEKRTGC